MDKTLDSVGNEYRLCILGDLNRWIGDWIRAGITSAFGVPVDNDNIMGEEWWCFAKKGDPMLVKVCSSTHEWQGGETVWRLKA